MAAQHFDTVEGRNGLQHRHFDELALTGALPIDQGGGHGAGESKPAELVADQTRARRQARRPCRWTRRGRMPLERSRRTPAAWPGAVLAEAGGGRVDDLGLRALQSS